MNRWMRRLHRWGALVTALPMLLVIVTGLLLQVKKEVTWVQPPTMRGSKGDPTLTFDRMLEIARTEPRAGIASWEDVARLDVRADRGLIKVVSNDNWELQLDARSGEVLHSAYRRSDLIEMLHDGSFFHDAAKLWIFLPNGLVLFGLWLTGAYLWWLPWQAKFKKRRRRRNGVQEKSAPPLGSESA